MEAVKKFLYQKDTLLWTPLLLDCCLAAITYPLFHSKGPRVLAQFMGMDQTDENYEEQVRDMEEDPKIRSVWETTMISYSAYATLLASSTYSAYYYPETRKALGWAMLSLMFAKIYHIDDIADSGKEVTDNKKSVLYWFYLPV